MEALRIGIIGARSRMSISIPWQKSDRAVVVAGMDIRPENLDAFKQKVNPDAWVTTDADELLSRDDIDAVAIFAPDFTHEEYTIKAFAAGKHVFCEKPMALTTAGADRMLAAWQRSGKKFMVGHNMRFMSVTRTMKEIVDLGVIGEVKAAWCRHFIDYGARYYFHDWHATQRDANTLLLQKGAHDIDIIHWIAGGFSTAVTGFGGLDFYGGDKPNDLECPTCPDRETCVDVQAEETLPYRQMCAFRKEVNVEDNQMILMNLDNGVRASYMQCHFAPDTWRNYTFIGTEGRVENLADGNVRVVTRRSNSYREYSDRLYQVKPTKGEHGGADALEAMDFLRLVIDGETEVASPVAARMAVAAGCAGAESIRANGRPVAVPALPAESLAHERETQLSLEQAG